MVAGRPVGIAGEDDVIHLRRTHRLVGGLAHDPTHGLDQVRLAAAVRADDPGQAGFDRKVGRFDKRFEADQAQPRELHFLFMSLFLSPLGGEANPHRFTPRAHAGRGRVPHRRGE